MLTKEKPLLLWSIATSLDSWATLLVIERSASSSKTRCWGCGTGGKAGFLGFLAFVALNIINCGLPGTHVEEDGEVVVGKMDVWSTAEVARD